MLLIEIARSLDLTPEEIETLQLSPICSDCDHRLILHDHEYGGCDVNGCGCSDFTWTEE